MMCQAVCIPKFEILFLFLHFRFIVICLMIMVLAARTCGSHLQMGGPSLFAFGVRGAWGVRRVHAKLQTICSIFKCCLCACMWWPEMGSVRGVNKCGGFDQGPAPAWTTYSAVNSPPFLSDSRPSLFMKLSACDWLFSQRSQHERTASLSRTVNS